MRRRDRFRVVLLSLAASLSLGSLAFAPVLAAQEPDQDTTVFRVTLTSAM